MASWTLARIVSSGLCSGCGACANAVEDGAISMRLDSRGYLRPVASRALTEREESSVRTGCPGIGLEHPKRDASAPEYSAEWGPIVSLSAGHARDAEVRHKGSSGGVLSALLVHLLESKAVDFVLHTRASREAPLCNEVVFSDSRESVLEAAGSRYAPAAPVAALGAALARPGRFAFVGKPCDVAAVRKILAARPELRDRIPFLLSFMCAGTPSIAGTHAILDRFGIAANDVVEFRYRGEGWPGNARAVSRTGKEGEMDYNTAWGTILNKYLQPRCKVCADGTGEFADVVCADAWHGKDGYPDFSEADGRSLVIARTATGMRLIEDAASLGSISLSEFPLSNLAEIQPYQLRRKRELSARLMAATVLFRPRPKYVAMGLGACARKLKWKVAAKAFLGTARRMLAGAM